MLARLTLACLVLTLVITGCQPEPLPEPNDVAPPGQLVQSEKPRVTSPNVPADDLAALVDGNTQFAFDLYQQVRPNAQNIIYSPYSISLALAMTYAGARGQTEQEMADTLHFTLPQERLHPAFDELDLALASRATPVDPNGQGFTLHIVNRLWGQTGFSFLPDFLDVLAENYGAGLALLDFAAAPEDSRVAINDWVATETANRITDLIPPGAIDSLTRLVLTNAIYFKAAWASQFNEAATSDQPFNLLDGSQVSVPMMRQTASYGYAAGDGYQVVELPYEGNQLSMVVLLPDAGRFEEFDSQLDGEHVATMLAGLSGQELDLSLAKFQFTWDTALADVLGALGMVTAFDPNQADFSGMDGQRDLFISNVIHKAFVAVDEQGTEAAAATAVIIGTTAAPAAPETVVIDRPFVFLIRDRQTRAILFLGRVLDPSS